MSHEEEVRKMTDEQLSSALVAMENVLMQMGRQLLEKRRNAAKFRKAIIEERRRRGIK